jgi:hypothetical protein
VTEVITREPVPVFETITLSDFALAITTLPNGTAFLSTENAGMVPVPDAVTVSGDVDPLCVKTMDELSAPAAVGVNVMPNFLVAPEVIEALVGPTVNRALLEVTELMLSVVFPVFVTVTLSVFVLPTATLPIESFFVLTENTPACTPRGVSVPPDDTWGERAIQRSVTTAGTVFM